MLAALLLAAVAVNPAPLRAGSEPTAQDGDAVTQAELRDWMRDQVARLADGLGELKERLVELGNDAGPAIDRAQQELGAAKQRLDAEMPLVRETSAGLMERLRSVAAEVGAALQDAMEQLRRRLYREDEGAPKEIRS